MAEYIITPVKRSQKISNIRKYSPNDEARGSGSYAFDQREKRNREGQTPQIDSFPDLFAMRIRTAETKEDPLNMTAITCHQTSAQPIIYACRRAKILASTLAFELQNMHMDE